MTTKGRETMKRLEGFDPISSDDLRKLEAPEGLLTQILESAPVNSQAQRRARARHSGRRRLAIPALGAVAAAVIVGLVLTIGSAGSGGSTAGNAVAELTGVAEAAAAQPPVAAGGPLAYLKTQTLAADTAVANGHSWSVYRPETREEWAAPDGSGRIRTVQDPPQFVGPGDRAAWEAAGSPEFLPPDSASEAEDREVPAGTFGTELAGLPSDPEALADVIETRAQNAAEGIPVKARMLELTAEYLADPSASPDLRRALYEAVAYVPDVQFFGGVSDPAGRQGVAVGVETSYSGGPERFLLIYDPKSSQVLATEDLSVGSQGFADAQNAVLASSVFLDAGSVQSLSSNETD